MKKLLMSIITFSLVLILTFSSSSHLESVSAINTSNLIERLGYDDEVRACEGTFSSSDGHSYVMIQTNTSSVNRSLQWGFYIRPSAYELFRPAVNVSMSASINGTRINSPYSSHYERPSYSFHGSLKNYQVVGQNYGLKSGDIVNFNWFALNPTEIKGVKNTTLIFLECAVK
ncbi:hypothetical protein [Lysinibacillus varians]|uniref:DUF4879 domain-containing protein n=1 Tax=Lysinibacillus varians TaxID=1145276 RepID=A0ABY2T9H4_9BACI|nr:hypothetical protein [Lysinibacillus varians]AHN20382.1 hypothetical protein T479_02130 [Lysinibacillus varians]TKI62940.1 hypothetical protein FC752_11550 [Lysinibacillus varians]